MSNFSCLKQLKRREDRWVRPSEVAKTGNEEELKTEVFFNLTLTLILPQSQ